MNGDRLHGLDVSVVLLWSLLLWALAIWQLAKQERRLIFYLH
jgi:hypothetical protein